MKGASASRAKRRAISVLPTPVGPIMRIFFGVISWRSGSATWPLRQRLRSAIATARFAASWPTMCLSNSWTISFGVIFMVWGASSFQDFDHVILIGVDAQVSRDGERLLDDLGWCHRSVLEQGARRTLRIGAAAADGDEAVFRLQHIAVTGNDERGFVIGHREHSL